MQVCFEQETYFRNVTKKELRKVKMLICKKKRLTNKKIFGVVNVNNEKKMQNIKIWSKTLK